MTKRINVKFNKENGECIMVAPETITEIKTKKSIGKVTVVNGTTYNSRSEAVREMLKAGQRKADIAKAIGASYSFVQTIADRSGIDYSATKKGIAEVSKWKKDEAAKQKKLDSYPKMVEKLENLLTKKIDIDARIEALTAEIANLKTLLNIEEV